MLTSAKLNTQFSEEVRLVDFKEMHKKVYELSSGDWLFIAFPFGVEVQSFDKICDMTSWSAPREKSDFW